MRSLFALTLVLGTIACDEAADPAAVDQAAPHFTTLDDLTHHYEASSHSVVAGVGNGTPNRRALLIVSRTGPGPGLCHPALGGGCLELLPPYIIADQGAFDAAGEWHTQVRLPSSVHGGALWMQFVEPGPTAYSSRPLEVGIP